MRTMSCARLVEYRMSALEDGQFCDLCEFVLPRPPEPLCRQGVILFVHQALCQFQRLNILTCRDILQTARQFQLRLHWSVWAKTSFVICIRACAVHAACAPPSWSEEATPHWSSATAPSGVRERCREVLREASAVPDSVDKEGTCDFCIELQVKRAPPQTSLLPPQARLSFLGRSTQRITATSCIAGLRCLYC